MVSNSFINYNNKEVFVLYIVNQLSKRIYEIY